MARELDWLSLGGLSSLFGKHKAYVPAPGERCRNCDTELSGTYCHVCGQNADLHKRNIFHLVWEAFEGLFHLDGRLWRTLPPLFFRPGTLNRDFIEGRLARHVPPFRLFLVALLLFIFSAEHRIEHALHSGGAGHATAEAGHASAGDTHYVATPATSASGVGAEASASEATETTVIIGPNTSLKTRTEADGSTTQTVNRNISILGMTEAESHYLAGEIKGSGLQPEWLRESVVRALENPKHYFLLMFTWGHRLAVLLLPILGLVLAAVNFRRGVYIHDHLIVAMNLLSFLFFSVAVVLATPEPVGGWLHTLLVLGTPVHLFATMRGAYGSSILTSIIKALIVSVLTVFSAGVVMLIVMSVAVLTI